MIIPERLLLDCSKLAIRAGRRRKAVSEDSAFLNQTRLKEQVSKFEWYSRFSGFATDVQLTP